MTTLALTPTDTELARRRAAAVRMAREGFSQTYIAKKLNVAQPTVCRWLQGTQGFGKSKTPVSQPEKMAEGAGNKPQNGRAPVLPIEHLKQVRARAKDWTGRKFSDAIFEAFGVRYSPRYCNSLLILLRKENSGATRFDISHSSSAGA